jgi:hypothetical protein
MDIHWRTGRVYHRIGSMFFLVAPESEPQLSIKIANFLSNRRRYFVIAPWSGRRSESLIAFKGTTKDIMYLGSLYQA